MTSENGFDHGGFIDGEEESWEMTDQEGGHCAEDDGGAGQVGLLRVDLTMNDLKALSLCNNSCRPVSVAAN